MVDHQRMAVAAPGCGEQHGGIDQGVLIDEIEEMLEQSGERAAVDRRCHHQHVGLLYQAERLLHRARDLGTPERASEVRCQRPNFDQMALARHLIGDQLQQVFCQGNSLGGALHPAGNRDDAEWVFDSHAKQPYAVGTSCSAPGRLRPDLLAAPCVEPVHTAATEQRVPMLGLAFNEVKWCYFNNP
ncbi:hypothetical protein XAB3213_300007 [Xanthomonas citri pv. bilvae]|nr:hypothetical protein XAB3213_300007 [Xanthomonas citri pv. bilvae]